MMLFVCHVLFSVLEKYRTLSENLDSVLILHMFYLVCRTTRKYRTLEGESDY
jgi:hypothetical protein